MFFFEKKNQKTFAHWRSVPTAMHIPEKSFLLLFFKKEVLFKTLPFYHQTPHPDAHARTAATPSPPSPSASRTRHGSPAASAPRPPGSPLPPSPRSRTHT